MVGVAAMRGLPDELPAFLRDPGAAAEVGELSREPDRSKGAGQPHDRERDTAHFVDLDDNGHVMNARGPDRSTQLPELKSRIRRGRCWRRASRSMTPATCPMRSWTAISSWPATSPPGAC